MVLEGPGADEGDGAGEAVAARLGHQARAGARRPHVVDPQIECGDRLEAVQRHPDGQTAGVIEQGGDQSAGQHPGVRIADQILPPRSPDAHAILAQAVVGEAEGVGMGGTRGELGEQGDEGRAGHEPAILRRGG